MALSDVEDFLRGAACKQSLEGIVSKRLARPYLPGDRGARIKTCLNWAEFVVVGWSDPEGSRPYIGALLLGYFEPNCQLIYAGRVGTGMSQRTLATLHKRLQPLAIKKMPLAAPPPRGTRFGRPLELARVHWIRPELVAEITYLSWPGDGLLRHTVFVGLREDKPAREVQRETPRTT
jgi:ATP-dependent DNA ligase